LVCCLRERELENAALLTECKDALAQQAQLEMLRAAMTIQSYVRRQESSVRIQGFVPMESQRRKHEQALASLPLIQGLVRGCLVRRNLLVLENAELVAECEDTLARLETLWASTVIQLHVRRRSDRSLLITQRESSICIQAFVRMESQRRRCRHTLTKVTLLQGLVRGWLMRRNPLTANTVTLPSTDKQEDPTPTSSMELYGTQDVRPEWQALVDKLNAVLQASKAMDSCNGTQDTESLTSTEDCQEIMFERDACNDYPDNKPAMIFCLLRENFGIKTTRPMFPRNDKKHAITATTPKQRKSILHSEYPLTYWSRKEGRHDRGPDHCVTSTGQAFYSEHSRLNTPLSRSLLCEERSCSYRVAGTGSQGQNERAKATKKHMSQLGRYGTHHEL